MQGPDGETFGPPPPRPPFPPSLHNVTRYTLVCDFQFFAHKNNSVVNNLNEPKKMKCIRLFLHRSGQVFSNSYVLSLDSTTNSVVFYFKEKYSYHFCETWQAGSVSTLTSV